MIATPARSVPRDLLRRARTARAALEAVSGLPSLMGYCVTASFLLQRVAAEINVQIVVVGGCAYRKIGRHAARFGHAWCELDDLRIDLTATQFWRTPKVYVTPAGDPRYGAPFARDEAVWQMATGADVARERLLRAYDAYLTIERKNRRD
jgi:hypothetical protein